MFKIEEGKKDGYDYSTHQEVLLNGDTLLTLRLATEKSKIGVFFRKKKDEKDFRYDDLIELEKIK